jgi:hypothetical protein
LFTVFRPRAARPPRTLGPRQPSVGRPVGAAGCFVGVMPVAYHI